MNRKIQIILVSTLFLASTDDDALQAELLTGIEGEWEVRFRESEFEHHSPRRCSSLSMSRRNASSPSLPYSEKERPFVRRELGAA